MQYHTQSSAKNNSNHLNFSDVNKRLQSRKRDAWHADLGSTFLTTGAGWVRVHYSEKVVLFPNTKLPAPEAAFTTMQLFSYFREVLKFFMFKSRTMVTSDLLPPPTKLPHKAKLP